MRWVLLVLGLHFPAAFSLLDCVSDRLRRLDVHQVAGLWDDDELAER